MNPVTQNNIIQTVTQTYLDNFTGAVNPTDIEAELLHKTQMAFDAQNAVAGKGMKWQIPKRLSPYQISQILLRLYPIKLVMLAGGNQDRDYGVLAMYDPNEGIYRANENNIHILIRQYDNAASGRERDDIIRTLHEECPQVTSTHDRDLIAVNNGIFNYATKQLMPFSPDYIFVAKSHVDYIDNPPLPVYHNPDDNTDWDVESWMNELSDDPEIIQALWEVLGAILRPHVRWNKAAWLYSETGNNGKGTLCELMRSLLGKGAYASIPIADFSKDFLLEPLIRSQAIIVDENNVGEYLDKSANLKAVITNDVIQINRKFKTPITYQFYGFMVQCINELPRVKDKTDSFYRRQLLIPFTKCFTGRERPYIKNDYLHRKDTLEYVLWKVLNTDYYQLSEPAASREALQEYKEYNDPVRQFVSEMLNICVWDFLPFSFLYDLYKSWLKRVSPNSQAVGKTTFTNELLKLIKDDPTLGWVCDDKQKQVRVGAMMSKAEYLIVQYDLTQWKNIAYRGNDLNQICTPIQNGKYRGIRRVITQPPAQNNP